MPTAIVRLVAEETFSWQKPVIDKDLTAPPAAVNGDRYIVGAGATGAWAGQDGKVAWYYSAAWYFDTPLAGWIAWVTDEARYYNYIAAWTEFNSVADALYIGSATEDGSWRIIIDGTGLQVAKRESGNWNEKGRFDP